MTDYTRNLTEAECLCLLKRKVFDLSVTADNLHLAIRSETYLSNDEKKRIFARFDNVQKSLDEAREFYNDTIGSSVKK